MEFIQLFVHSHNDRKENNVFVFLKLEMSTLEEVAFIAAGDQTSSKCLRQSVYRKGCARCEGKKWLTIHPKKVAGVVEMTVVDY